MMGAGKSSVGRSLHRRTGMAFLATDEIVASNFGMSIPQIFSTHGEKKFRKAETEALQTISRTKPAIIVTGGGIVLRKGNVEILKHLGLIVWLDGDEEALFARASRTIRSAIAENEKPERGVLANLPCAQASVRTNCGYPCRYIAAYSRRSRHGDSE